MEDNNGYEPHEELADILDAPENLNGEEPVDLNAAEEVPQETGETQPEEPAQEAEPKEETEEVPPTSEDADKRFEAMLAKSNDERAKRQRAEDEIATLRNQVNQMQAAQQPKIDPLEDPEGWQRQQTERLAQQEFQTRLNMSEMIVKSQNPDYDSVVDVFAEEAKANPSLRDAMVGSDIPAKFAYDEGKKIMAMREFGNDPAAFKQQLRDEVKAEILAEIKANTPKPDIPQSIANSGSKAPASAEVAPADDLATLLGEVE